MMGDRSRLAPVALVALLLLSSVVAPFATGLVGAQSSTYTYDFEPSDTRFIAMDISNFEASTFTIKITAQDGPGGSPQVLYHKEHTKAGLNDVPAFENAQAYDNLTVEIIDAPAEPNKVAKGSEFGRINWDNKNRLGSTGGDRDLTCDDGEELAMAVNPAVNIIDCNMPSNVPETTDVNTTGIDANETKLEIYQSASTQAGSAENFHTMLKNRLQDTETVALMKGKGGYIRALNDGESKTSAEAEATSNITEYYSVMERNIISEWNGQVSNAQYLRSLAIDETGVPDSTVFVPKRNEHGNVTSESSTTHPHVNVTGFSTGSVQLQNGSSVEVQQVEVTVMSHYDDGSTENWQNTTFTLGPTTGPLKDIAPDSDGYPAVGEDPGGVDIHWVEVLPPNDNYDPIKPLKFGEYESRMSEIDSQTTSANNQMDTVVNQTYDGYTAGEINSSDLVDPYVLQNQFSPGDEYQGWSAATLALLGTNQPTDLDQTGYMKVNVSGGQTFKGILQAGGNPPGGEFVVGETYDPANVTGSVFVTTDSKVKEITSPFTLENATTYDGQVRTNVTIEKKTYNTTSAEDLKKLNEELSLLREEISAREDNMSGGTGGGGLLGGSSQSAVLIIAAGAVAVVVLGSGGRR